VARATSTINPPMMTLIVTMPPLPGSPPPL
jgi:hypothetical protein